MRMYRVNEFHDLLKRIYKKKKKRKECNEKGREVERRKRRRGIENG